MKNTSTVTGSARATVSRRIFDGPAPVVETRKIICEVLTLIQIIFFHTLGVSNKRNNGWMNYNEFKLKH